MNITPINTIKNSSKQQNFNGFTPKFVAQGYDRFTDSLAKGMGKIMDTRTVQNFAKKFHDTNIATHIFSATGILLSSFFIFSTAKSKKIEDTEQKYLMLNNDLQDIIDNINSYFDFKTFNKESLKDPEIVSFL